MRFLNSRYRTRPSLTEAAQYQIKRLDAGDSQQAQAWDQFIFAHPCGTFFHRAAWQKVIAEQFGHKTYYFYAEKDGKIEAVLPTANVSSWLFGNALTSLPFAVYGGVLASQEAAGAALVREASDWAQKLGVDHLELRNMAASQMEWPRQDIYVTFRKEILADPEANMLAIPRKQRAMVRKGIKNELISVIDQDAGRFFELYADNVHRHGTPAMSKRYFVALLKEFGPDCEVLSVLSADGKPLSSVLSFYFRDEVLPYYAGDDESARHLAANDFKYWELMRRSCERGLKIFDFGRSKKDTGSFAFKKNWGFEATQLSYEYCLFKGAQIPQNNPSNPKYKLLIQTWRKLPIGLANWLGPFIVRYLG